MVVRLLKLIAQPALYKPQSLWDLLCCKGTSAHSAPESKLIIKLHFADTDTSESLNTCVRKKTARQSVRGRRELMEAITKITLTPERAFFVKVQLYLLDSNGIKCPPLQWESGV